MCGSILHNAIGVSAHIQRFRGARFFETVNRFLRQPIYLIALSVLTVVFNLLRLDLLTYSCYFLLGIYIALFAEDLLAMMPLVIFCYIAPSPFNNPGKGANTGSVFYPENGGWFLYALLAVFVLCFVLRLAFDPAFGRLNFWKTKRKLWPGMLCLGVAYLLSGLGMAEYPEIYGKNLFFAGIQFASVFMMYFIFSGAVNWKKVPRDYFAWIGMCVGFVILPQLLENYLSGRIFMGNSGTIDRELMFTGWGMHNNIGGMMAMMIPFPFYLALRNQKGWVFTLLSTILMLGVLLSCSRTSMIVGSVSYVICAAGLLKRCRHRRLHVRVLRIAAGCVAAVCAIFWQQLSDIFRLFFEELFLISQRDNLVQYGTKQFLAHPVFGGSFFPQGEYVPWTWITSDMGAFFPPRWHNTLVQVGASCGAVGLAAYCFHRIQTVQLLCRKPSLEKRYIGFYMGILLVLSLFDCHFFNVGPVLFYSMALAFGEKIELSEL